MKETEEKQEEMIWLSKLYVKTLKELDEIKNQIDEIKYSLGIRYEMDSEKYKSINAIA